MLGGGGAGRCGLGGGGMGDGVVYKGMDIGMG